ncbi:MAG: hypothetical protein EZS28_016707 [Streblomastix strix]|uniref:Uncharacterized protein n=1 Tax=Streblomastix strix TaxID=222440 RepID=A0A5J4VZV0_9EUKA|nr:MAG: hypothetical protein EZS28_016707 [Streblomastix strix]
MYSFDTWSSFNVMKHNWGYLELISWKKYIQIASQMIDHTTNCRPKLTTTNLFKQYEISKKTEDNAEKIKEAQEIVQLHQEVRVAERALNPGMELIFDQLQRNFHQQFFQEGSGEGGLCCDAGRSGLGKRGTGVVLPTEPISLNNIMQDLLPFLSPPSPYAPKLSDKETQSVAGFCVGKLGESISAMGVTVAEIITLSI